MSASIYLYMFFGFMFRVPDKIKLSFKKIKNLYRRQFLALLLILSSTYVYAEDAQIATLQSILGKDELTFSGFIDTAFSYGFNHFDPRQRAYLTQPSRNREGQINLAYLEAKLTKETFRFRLATQAGSSVDVNYGAEAEKGVRYIQEASIGTKLGPSLWLDGGIYLSHIGLESFISKDNWAYTRLLASDFSPYYQSGAKLSYEVSKSLNLQLHYINGWQNISDFSGRNALGTQVSYSFETGDSLIYNTFLGSESEGTRFFNDFIFKLAPIGKLELAALFDIGNQQQTSGDTDQWYSWAVLSRYTICPEVKFITRVEQYIDRENVIVRTPSNDPFSSLGFSTGIDVELYPKLLWRSEYRAFVAQNSIFATDSEQLKRTDHFVISSLSYSF